MIRADKVKVGKMYYDIIYREFVFAIKIREITGFVLADFDDYDLRAVPMLVITVLSPKSGRTAKFRSLLTREILLTHPDDLSSQDLLNDCAN